MKKLLLLSALVVGLAFTSSAFAGGYGAAGCGFGGMLIKENKKLHQVGAWFLNGISGNQTFGITSGTSECGSSGLVLADKEQAIFVKTNYHSLAKEMASGTGEDLSTLAGLLGCPTHQVDDFGGFTQANYLNIFQSPETTPVQMLEALKKNMSSDPRFSTSCNRI